MLDHDKAVEQLMGTGEKGAAIMEIFGARAGPAFAALLAQGSKGLRDFTHNVRNNEGATKRAADVMMTGWEGVMKRFSSAAEGFQIAWGNRLIPTLTPLMEGMTSLFGQATEFVNSLDRRISVFDRMGVAVDGLVSGMGFRDAGDMLARFRDLAVGGLFGTEGRFLQDAEALGRLSVTTRRIGENFRAAADSLLRGQLIDAMSGLKSALSDMPAMGSILTLYAMGKGLGLLAGGVSLLAGSPWVRGALALYAMANLIDRFRGAEDFSQFVDSLKDLSTIEWLGIAAGAAVVSGVLWKLGRNVFTLTRAMKSLFALKPPARPAPPASAVRPPAAAPLGNRPGARPPVRPWGEPRPAGPNSRGRPTGPRGGSATPVRSAPWRFGGAAGVANFLRGGAFTALTNYLGETAIEQGFRAAGKEPVELPSILDNIRTILNEIDVKRTGGAGDGPAWDALREIPSPQDHINELEQIRRMLQGDGSPDDVSILNEPTVHAPPQGVQDVRVTNPPPAPNVTVSLGGVHIHGIANLEDAANRAAEIVGRKTREAVAGIHSDTGYSVS